VSPLVVLSVCDEAKLTDELGLWIINQAFSDLRRWHDMGFDMLHLSANISPKQLREDDGLIQSIRQCIARTGLNTAYMVLELTEDAAVDQSLSTRQKLEEIKATGISIAIDDFGMGNSSLLYLRDFYANIVKMDISLVRRINTDIHSQEIVRSILKLCDQLKVGVVAEGVETLDQMQTLHEMGCDNFQGFYFSRSLPYEQFLEFVREHGAVEGRM
jgi:EAL domain-containing protein (putative c-di-GMP-specific phosphodiesterase class I)